MAKQSKVKWALGGEEPEDLQDFLSNEEIEQKHDGDKPKGKYKFAVRRIVCREIQNGDNAGEIRLSLMLVINEPKKSENASWNGYLVWDGLNVTDQGRPYIKRFMQALGLTWDDFINKSKQDDQDPPHITQIGSVKFEAGKDPIVEAVVRIGMNNKTDEQEVKVSKYVPKGDGEAAADDDSGADESAETFDADAGDEGEGDDPWTRADLEDEDFDTVMGVATDDLEVDKSDIPKKIRKGEDVSALLDWLVENEHLEGSAEDGGDDREEQIEAIREELKGKTLKDLRKRAVRNEIDTEGMKKNDLINAIVEAEVPPF
jgi:hypothetical protein